MIIHHFDGRSLKLRDHNWLRAAIADANIKASGCAVDNPEHAKMWQRIAEEYISEQIRRALKSR